MFSILFLAIFVGMHHATETDHVAAVASIASGRKSISDIVAQGVTWGIGHTLTLFLFAGCALILGFAIPDSVASKLEGAVGIMLVGLGLHVFWRLWKDRVHFHAHSHGDGNSHFHAHSHAGEKLRHEWSPHGHVHRFKWRTLLVGMTHGMAGSAALLLLTVSQAPSALMGLAYILLFGVGTIIGMGLVSAVIGLPISRSAKSLTWANRGLQGAFGLITIYVGATIIQENLVTLL